MTEAAPHPGFFLKEKIKESGMTVSAVALLLGIGRPNLHHVMAGKFRISAGLAVKLEAAGLGTARIWMLHQLEYDLEQAIKAAGSKGVGVQLVQGS
jgi:addiction module HigA family antidote